MSITILDPNKVIELFRGDAGLICGPGASTYPTIEEDLYDALANRFKRTISTRSWLDLADLLVVDGLATPTEIHNFNKDFWTLDRPDAESTQSIIRAGWSCVIALTPDLSLHKRLKESFDAEPSGWQLTTITNATCSTPLNTLPYFAMMGDYREFAEGKRLCGSGAEYLTRKRLWPRILMPVSDIVKGNPLVFLGTSTIASRVVDLIDSLLALYPRCPTRLIFLESDECIRSARLRNLAGENMEILVFPGPQDELLRVISRDHRSIYELPLFSLKDTGELGLDELKPISDFAVPVPSASAITPNPNERRKNLDALFRSSSLDWSPFALGLHFARDIEDQLFLFLRDQWTLIPSVFEVRGEAACGKSISLKSIAFRLATEGFLVIWLRRSFGDLSGNNIALLAPAITQALRKTGRRVIIVLDDPIACGFDSAEIESALRRCSFDWRIICCHRKTDYITAVPDRRAAPVSQDFPDDFSEAEWKRLPDYLVKIGISKTVELAQRELSRVPSADGRDVLCALWYLLPQTKETLFNSLSNEYLRLGGLEHTIEKIALSVSGDSAKVVRQAYEFVTVCDGLNRAPLPLEVLVGALCIPYSAWTSQCENNKPIWGLLMEEFFDTANTIVYRNRNEVVTRVLLGIINGPDGYHAGELRILKALLGACISAQPQYVEFIKWILVERRSILEERFSLVQITDLYDTAIKACPIRLGIVEHHRAIARSHQGASPLAVHAELVALLKNTGGAREEHGDSPENMNTSAAASLVRAVRAGEVDPVSISREIFAHISLALGTTRLNWHAYHTHAKSLIELGAHTKASSPKFAVKCFTEASRISERAILLLDPLGGGQGKLAEDCDFFRSIRNDLIRISGDLEQAKTSAERVFDETRDQTAFVMVLRTMAAAAARDDRNSEYKKVDEYARLIGSRITNSGQIISTDFTACRVENEFRWKVIKGSTSRYDKESALNDVRTIMLQEPYRSDVMWGFMEAVLAFLTRDYCASDAGFTGLRRLNIDSEIRAAVRCYLTNQQGIKQVLEGTIARTAAPRVFIYSPDLESDVLGFSREFPGAENKPVHFYLGFSINGPIACSVSDSSARRP
jgi:hypothetical protein